MPLKPMLAPSQAIHFPREIEAQTLLMAARKLLEVQTNWNGPDKNMHKLRCCSTAGCGRFS
jgi:hypothetical protein